MAVTDGRHAHYIQVADMPKGERLVVFLPPYFARMRRGLAACRHLRNCVTYIEAAASLNLLFYLANQPHIFDAFSGILRQVFVDLCLSDPLGGVIDSGIKRVVFAYDIACQYSIHFSDRIRHPDFPLFTEEQLHTFDKLVLDWLIGKFHLGAHVPECADTFSFNYTLNVGRSYGELPESNWSSLNGFAISTREMSWGHRRDILTDVMGDWNWRKNTKMGS